MNAFILCTGRCGSVTFAKACSHIINFSVGHESRIRHQGSARVDYPAQHIEVDNRLCWFLGRLESRFGDNATYVHLTRDRDEVAKSFNRRWHMRGSIMRGYVEHICMTTAKDPLAACHDYVDTVTANISAFLRDKSRVITVDMATVEKNFDLFWKSIGAKGDFDAALAEWAIRHNSSK